MIVHSPLQRLRRAQRAQGFTLIEVMVVVVLVGILATLALVAMRRWLVTSKSIEAMHVIEGIRGGEEPYPGADADARAIDTRMGTPSKRAAAIDRALRARPRDDGLKGIVIRFLATGATDTSLWQPIAEASGELEAMEEETRQIATRYRIHNDVAVVDASDRRAPYDKTYLLLLGQERARIAVVYDKTTVTAAARFDSGVNLLEAFGLEGGMPTRVSVARKQLAFVLERLGADPNA